MFRTSGGVTYVTVIDPNAPRCSVCGYGKCEKKRTYHSQHKPLPLSIEDYVSVPRVAAMNTYSVLEIISWDQPALEKLILLKKYLEKNQ